MSLAFGQTVFLLPPSPLHRRTIPSRQHQRARKRRRLKLLTVRNDFNPTPSSFDNLFHSLISQIPSVSSLNYIAPTLGLASGLALFFSSDPQKLLSNPKIIGTSSPDIGEWILFTSPTPFNRFVTLRCPSIHFPENDNISEKLIKEDRHYVKLNSGRIIQPVKSDDDVAENMVYQRLCVGTEDGGVLSLDWPANLDLEEEQGFDTTVLVVPGTPEGSSERKIGVFVCDCLRRGVFPVVMNPRGCAGSPLTTPRLFTAADSDDISTAVQYITKKRPWTTLMAVGWGYGANMLTKYLAERGERTPLTAATCIDNPFDLEEAMRSSVYQTDFDQRHTDGLIKILQCNKELFQGRGKGFDVKRALTATSVWDFERAISMVSYGFDTIEEFYAKSSTRDVVGKVKVPVLFIQNDDGKAPLFSIPRSLIADNPYTSLLLCSYKPSSKIMDDNIVGGHEHDGQNAHLQWLAAVELGLLKGRHPLLNDVDVTLNPSKGLALIESRDSNKRGRVDRLLNLTNGSSTNTQLEMLQANDMAMSIQSRSANNTEKQPPSTKGLKQENNSVRTQSNATVDAIVEEGIDSIERERGQVLQTAQVVLNMLDITMPDTLSDEQKKKVLNAVGQGETLIKALQDAVPEDVQGKLTTAVSGILQNRRTDLNFDKLLSLGHIPDVTSKLNSKVLGQIRPKKENSDEDLHQKKRINNSEDGSSNVDYDSDKSPGDIELEKQSSEISQKQNDAGVSQSTSNHESNRPDLEKVNPNVTGNSNENEQSSGGNTVQISDREIVSEINVNQELSNISGGPEGSKNAPIQKKVETGTGKGQADSLEGDNKPKDGSSNEQDKISEASKTEEKPSASSPASEVQVMEHEAESNQRKEEKGPTSELCSKMDEKSSASSPASEGQLEHDGERNQRKEEKGPTSELAGSTQNISDPPSFSVSQALDALTGFDDSTQVAVNSVFHVIEDMIDQLEVENDNVNEVKNKNNITENGTEEVKEQNDTKSAGTMDLRTNASSQSVNSDGTLSNDSEGSGYNYKQQPYKHSELDNTSSDTDYIRSQVGSEGKISFAPAAGEVPTRNFVKCLNSSSKKVPSIFSAYPFGDPLYKEHLKTYLSSKMENAKPKDMDKMVALYLDYIPEEGRWKLLEQTEDNLGSVDEYAAQGDYREDQANSQTRSKHSDNIIEPSYVILDSGEPQDRNEELKKDTVNNSVEFDETKFDESTLSIKSLILECLNVEVGRKASGSDMEDLEHKVAKEIEYVADVVSKAAGQGKHHRTYMNDNLPDKLGTLDGENIIRAISSSLQETQYLRTVLPVGVVVGSTLAALRKFFNVAAAGSVDEQTSALDQVDILKDGHVQVGKEEGSQRLLMEREDKDNLTSSIDGRKEDTDIGISKNQVMVGAVTAALGASALLAHQPNTETSGPSDKPLKESAQSKELAKLDEMPEKIQNNIVTSIAEKAMSVASPVMPVKEDGAVDHERLVAMLAELGQKGGFLKLVGKVALLWGGIRGAMSLTDKLITFLRIADRPLFQRILGFVFMVLLLWSPVSLPLLPALMQSWATRSPFKIAELALIAGLYVSIMIMITLWGKRIRKYDDPLLQYGLDLASLPKLQNFLKGLVGGTILVILIHAVNSSFGCARLCWPTTLSSTSLEPIAILKSYLGLLFLIIKGIATAAGVAVVEELFFRSWLPKEIAVDFGFHRGVLISGLLFALSQRSIWEIPGLWLLSLSLSGALQRSQGSLSLPIGLRAGILASNFILKSGGFLTYQPNFPLWVTGGHPFQPFSGVVGLAFSLILAVIFYPRQPLNNERTTRVIRD